MYPDQCRDGSGLSQPGSRLTSSSAGAATEAAVSHATMPIPMAPAQLRRVWYLITLVNELDEETCSPPPRYQECAVEVSVPIVSIEVLTSLLASPHIFADFVMGAGYHELYSTVGRKRCTLYAFPALICIRDSMIRMSVGRCMDMFPLGWFRTKISVPVATSFLDNLLRHSSRIF